MKTIGYIVECRGHGAMLVSDGELYFGNHATLFPTRKKAKKAIKLTIKNRRDKLDRDFEEEFGRLEITRVKEA